VHPLLQWKAVSVTYCECGFVALVMQHAMRMRQYYIVISEQFCSTANFYFISKTT